MQDTTRLVLSVSSALTSAEERDVDRSIELALRQSAELTGADRTYVFLLSDSGTQISNCLLYTSPSPRDRTRSRMPSSA